MIGSNDSDFFGFGLDAFLDIDSFIDKKDIWLFLEWMTECFVNSSLFLSVFIALLSSIPKQLSR
jgi:hypothetical protein